MGGVVRRAVVTRRLENTREEGTSEEYCMINEDRKEM